MIKIRMVKTVLILFLIDWMLVHAPDFLKGLLPRAGWGFGLRRALGELFMTPQVTPSASSSNRSEFQEMVCFP